MPKPLSARPPRDAEEERQVRRWLCAWARLHIYWRHWSTAPLPPELAVLLGHVGRSLPLDALT